MDIMCHACDAFQFSRLLILQIVVCGWRLGTWYMDGLVVRGWLCRTGMVSWSVNGLLVRGWPRGPWMVSWSMNGLLVRGWPRCTCIDGLLTWYVDDLVVELFLFGLHYYDVVCIQNCGIKSSHEFLVYFVEVI